MIGKFLKSRGARKFFRSKTAVLALGVILVYIGIALSIIVTGSITLEETETKIATESLRGFGLKRAANVRLNQANSYLKSVEKQLDRAERLELELPVFAGRSVAEIRAIADKCASLDPGAEGELEQLETILAELFPTSESLDPSADNEARLAAVNKRLTQLTRSSSWLSDLGLGSLRLNELPSDELFAIVDQCWDTFDQIDEHEDLDSPEALEDVEKLEKTIATLFAPLTGAEQRIRDFKLLLGTDRQGRPILIRAIYSVKVAVQIGLVTALISVILGGLLGAAAGFFGSWVDMVVIWLYSTFSSVPNLVLLAVLAFAFSESDVEQTLIPVYFAFCMTFWIGPCRVVRGEVLKLKELEYVQAATAIGFGRFYILVRHIIPNAAHLLFINFSLLFIGAIKSEVILSFLGLGVKKGPSWGIMISQSNSEVSSGFFWQIGSATAFMFGLVLAFNVLSDALQDAFDPKHV